MKFKNSIETLDQSITSNIARLDAIEPDLTTKLTLAEVEQLIADDRFGAKYKFIVTNGSPAAGACVINSDINDAFGPGVTIKFNYTAINRKTITTPSSNDYVHDFEQRVGTSSVDFPILYIRSGANNILLTSMPVKQVKYDRDYFYVTLGLQWSNHPEQIVTQRQYYFSIPGIL